MCQTLCWACWSQSCLPVFSPSKEHTVRVCAQAHMLCVCVSHLPLGVTTAIVKGQAWSMPLQGGAGVVVVSLKPPFWFEFLVHICGHVHMCRHIILTPVDHTRPIFCCVLGGTQGTKVSPVNMFLSSTPAGLHAPAGIYCHPGASQENSGGLLEACVGAAGPNHCHADCGHGEREGEHALQFPRMATRWCMFPL